MRPQALVTDDSSTGVGKGVVTPTHSSLPIPESSEDFERSTTCHCRHSNHAHRRGSRIEGLGLGWRQCHDEQRPCRGRPPGQKKIRSNITGSRDGRSERPSHKYRGGLLDNNKRNLGRLLAYEERGLRVKWAPLPQGSQRRRDRGGELDETLPRQSILRPAQMVMCAGGAGPLWFATAEPPKRG
jgi:hypothetical protein